MTDAEKLKAELELPPISHMGVVVRNMDEAVDYYSSIFGIGPFNVYEFKPEKHWFKEEPSPLRLMMGKAMWGNVELELIQHLEGKAVHKEFLETQGEGLHHLGFLVPNYDEMLEKFKGAGFAPLMRCDTYVENYGGTLKACYFDTRRIGGIIFEILWRSWVKM